MRNFFIVFLLTLSFLTLACKDKAKANLASAQKMFNRLQIGMGHKDAAWYSGFTFKDAPYMNYEKDFGMSFSKKEYTLRLFVREGKLLRVDIIKPGYVKGVRQGSAGEIVAEKGVSLEEAMGRH